tara:strand:- start:2982 stop:3116 length:135 start_codon:yes stop_codon:yes gene_type:complete
MNKIIIWIIAILVISYITCPMGNRIGCIIVAPIIQLTKTPDTSN